MFGTFIEFKAPEAIVKIPTDAAAWQLYSDMPGAAGAARALTAALKRALRASDREEAIKVMREAMDKRAQFGASDTEPRCVAERCLTQGRGSDYSWSL